MATAFPSFIRILLREIVVFFKLGINLIRMRSVTSWCIRPVGTGNHANTVEHPGCGMEFYR